MILNHQTLRNKVCQNILDMYRGSSSLEKSAKMDLEKGKKVNSHSEEDESKNFQKLEDEGVLSDEDEDNKK